MYQQGPRSSGALFVWLRPRGLPGARRPPAAMRPVLSCPSHRRGRTCAHGRESPSRSGGRVRQGAGARSRAGACVSNAVCEMPCVGCPSPQRTTGPWPGMQAWQGGGESEGATGAAGRGRRGKPAGEARRDGLPCPCGECGTRRSRSACPGHPAVCLVRRPAAIRRAAGQNSCTVAPGRGELRASFFDLRGFSLAAAAPPVVWGGGTPRRMPFFRRVSCCPPRPPRAKQAATPPGCGPFLPWRPDGGRARSRPGVRLCKIFVPTGAFRGEDVKKIKRTLDGS